ncbi:hypothetical protein [Nocardioides sp. zg-1230]|uniref:hypothetical protein n=1 Tax=Nocardioides sp. zg-1230 TaxID=2736601 RepID=UPI001556A5E1|nr:hypothetical protein [Nocardioides sp. zg-1230]NPC43117.1 hypothetical protein [Nocardioides sp. zg-1230]
MSATTTRKSATRKPAAKAAPKEQKPEPVEIKATAKKESEPQPEPKTLIEALTTGQAALIKVRANKTTRSLPYLAVGTEERKQAEAVAKMREGGATVDSIAESLKVSTATARRFLTNLALAHAVEAGDHDKAWTKGAREVIVHTVEAKKA